MTKKVYNVYILIDKNTANLDPSDLAPWDEIDFKNEVEKD